MSFLDDLLPEEGLVVDVDADLSYSSRDGLTLSGQASLTVARAVGLKLGPLTVDRYELSLGTSGGGIAAGLGVAATLTLGPVELVGRREWASGPRSSPGPGTSVRPTSPSGPPRRTAFGVVIDAGVVTGGGFVQRDAAGDYVGALELQLGKIGRQGDRPAVDRAATGPCSCCCTPRSRRSQIGFGFTLEGIGGVLGVQRGGGRQPAGQRDADAARSTTCCSRPDPVGDAPRIIATLRQLFPMRRNTLTVGPMVDVHWGKPVIITARLAVLIQLDNALGGGPLALSKVVVVGQLRAAVGATEEDPDARVLVLIIDVLGFWDLAEKRYGFLAALRDSSVAGIDLTGGLAVWGEYGDHPSFLLAAGGFNPRFKDVPATVGGAVARLGASFSVGRFDLTLTGYFAVTPATIQAGLNLQATAKIGPVGLDGEIGFDVLIYRRPRTHFIADFRFSAEVTYRGHSLAGVKVAGTIEGPGRWHVVGKVSFSILWWDISKSFDESWGTPPPLVREQVDVRALLAAELAKPENWSAQVPTGGQAIVTLAPRRGDLSPRAHPLARCVFVQQAVPLGLAMDRFGDAAVAGPNQFDIEAVTIGGRAAHGRRHADRRPAGARALRPRAVRRGVRGRAAHQAGVRAARRRSRVHAPPASTSAPGRSGPPMSVRDPLPRPRDRARSAPRPGRPPRATASTTACSRRSGGTAPPGRAAQRVVEQTAAVRIPLGGGRAAGGGRRPRHPGQVDLGGPATTAEVLVEQRLRRAGVAAQVVETLRAGERVDRGRLHVPALGPPRPRRSNPARGARPAAARPGHASTSA